MTHCRQNLDVLIAHTRTYDIFPLFSARIALHHAHLAHALARPARALRCYRAAAHHSEPGSFVNVAARAGEIALCVGVRRRKATMGEAWRQGLSLTDDDWTEDDEAEDLEERGAEVIELCHGMGGTLEAIGQVLEACFTPEILKAKYVRALLTCVVRLWLMVCVGSTSSMLLSSRPRHRTTTCVHSSLRLSLPTTCIRPVTMHARCFRRASSSRLVSVLLRPRVRPLPGRTGRLRRLSLSAMHPWVSG